MQKEINWRDLHYYSEGKILLEQDSPLSIKLSSEMSLTEFTKILLAAASEAERVKNLSTPPNKQWSNFSKIRDTKPVYNEELKKYVKSSTFTFAIDTHFTREEIEGE